MKVFVAAALTTASLGSAFGAEAQVRLITLDPGHFHAGLVQKMMYPQVSPVVHVYAPGGPELQEHLQRIESYNQRADDPTRWQQRVYTGPDFFERMLKEKAGNVVVLAGNNARKTEYIYRSINAGLNVLADKPMAINPGDFKLLRKAFDRAEKKDVLLYDIMTERHEITSMMQRELAHMPEVFGSFEKGSPADPAVEKESVHHFFKEVSGKPLVRPAWFYDVEQQGEAITDVATHLVDLVQWGCFPEQTLNWKKDVKVLEANRWPTRLTPDQFKRSTGLANYPEYLKKYVGPDNTLDVYQNGDITYALRGIHAKVRIVWNFEAPAGTKDTHYSMMRGTKARLVIKQGAEQNYQPILYVENRSGAKADQFARTLNQAVVTLAKKWPGLEVKPAGPHWEIVIPSKYSNGHEAHFAEVTEHYLDYLNKGKLPQWEVPNMIAKYYTTTEAHRLAHSKLAKKQ
ncbi:MAG TPA: putative oxidoreductase C-terminal domain-containing protein [Clostridia bacterium]|nr:putative oxidoreductase C-terminal domain-containing protein [Clostridia bacterium]